MERFFRLVLSALLFALRVSVVLILSHLPALWLPLRIAASAPAFLAGRLVAWRLWLVRFQLLRVGTGWSLRGLFRAAASLLARLAIPSSGLILAPLLVAKCLAVAFSGASFAAGLAFRDSLVSRNVPVLPGWLEPLITAVWSRWKISLCRSIPFTCTLPNAPALLANPLVKLLTPNGCDYLRRSFFADRSSFDTRRQHAENIPFNPVPPLAGSHHVAVNIPAPFEARPPDRLFGSPLNFSEIGSVVKDHHVVDVRDFRHVYGVVDDGYVLARGNNIGSQPWCPEMPDRTKVVVLRPNAETHID